MVTGRRKLLLADDSVAIQKVVQLTFADEGVEVAVAGSGDEALRKLEEYHPDVVLADISMPGLNGYEVCKWIRRDERFRQLPVLLLVGIFEPFDAKEAREAGADDVLTKPFQSIREMVSKVSAYFTGRPSRGSDEAEEEAAAVSPRHPRESGGPAAFLTASQEEAGFPLARE